MNKIEAFIRDAAKRRGISPDIAVKVARSEGGVSEPAVLAKFATGWSWWPFQLHYGGAEYPQYGTEAGQGNGFTKLTGWAPGDPAAWRDSVRYALNRAKASGWGAWYGAAAVGVGKWDGIDRAHPWDAHAETWDYETRGATVGAQLRVTEDRVRLRERPDTQAPILYEARAGELVTPLTDHAWRQVRANGRDGWMAAEYLESNNSSTSPGQSDDPTPKLQFDPNTPTELQRQDWTCSIRSTMWMLKSLGIAVTPEEAQDAMSPRYVTPDLGLLDASGAGIVQALHDRWGVGAKNDASATFDEVLAAAGKMPVAIGLRNWGGPGKGHWSAVRGVTPQGALVLANPAGNGPVYGQGALSREQFDSRGPASMVVVPLGA